MKTEGEFTIHTCQLVIPKDADSCRIIFFGDVHRDSRNHAKTKWKDFLSYARTLENTYFMGMGDYVDSASTSERICLNTGGFHDTTIKDIQDLAAEKVKLLANELSFMKGRLIGLINGNHYFKFQDGTTTDHKLCGLLGCKYLGVSSFIRIYVSRCRVSGGKLALDVWAHHGTGGARLFGGSINRVDQMREHAEADVYVMGHDHKRGVVPAMPRLYLDHSSKQGLRVRERQQWLIRSGSYLASYEPGTKNYNVDAGRGPCSLGHVELIISLRRERIGKIDNLKAEIRGVT